VTVISQAAVVSKILHRAAVNKGSFKHIPAAAAAAIVQCACDMHISNSLLVLLL